MNLDVRLPIGLMFSIFGLLLAATGLLSPAHSMSLGINVNLWWGLVMIVFGLTMLGFALRARGGANGG